MWMKSVKFSSCEILKFECCCFRETCPEWETSFGDGWFFIDFWGSKFIKHIPDLTVLYIYKSSLCTCRGQLLAKKLLVAEWCFPIVMKESASFVARKVVCFWPHSFYDFKSPGTSTSDFCGLIIVHCLSTFIFPQDSNSEFAVDFNKSGKNYNKFIWSEQVNNI